MQGVGFTSITCASTAFLPQLITNFAVRAALLNLVDGMTSCIAQLILAIVLNLLRVSLKT